MYSPITMYSAVNEIILKNNITYSLCTWGESVLVCLKFLHFVQFFLIDNQYAHLCRFLKI